MAVRIEFGYEVLAQEISLSPVLAFHSLPYSYTLIQGGIFRS